MTQFRKGIAMSNANHKNYFGFSAVEALIALLIVAALGLGGWYVWHHRHMGQTANRTTTTQSSINKSADSYAGWKTYKDTGYASASGINFKYPANWRITVAGRDPVGNTTNPVASINLRSVDLATPQTPLQEWTTCATVISGDACGAGPEDKTLSGSETTINGLEAYNATMQSTLGTYYVTVIKSDKSTLPTGTPFVELTTSVDDSSLLAVYKQIMASATFPNDK
jgi:Tfp pilus assembly protein PilV